MMIIAVIVDNGMEAAQVAKTAESAFVCVRLKYGVKDVFCYLRWRKEGFFTIGYLWGHGRKND